MKNDFLTFERFDQEHAALQMAALLTQFNVPFEFENNSAPFDPSFNPGGGEKSYSIKLRKEDFERAHLIVEEDVNADTDILDPDYYLLSFTNTELRDVVVTRDEWSPFDVALSQKLLKARGAELSAQAISDMRTQRIIELSKPEKDQSLYITIGYFCALMGGLLGLFIGWHLQTHKKTLPNGNLVHAYSEDNRRSGKRIVMVGIVCLIGWALYYTSQIIPLVG
ncbi:MAG: hypothetical protein EOO43_27080 [Flavobacterium sp.]|nr:MAG: hypothetical protein EOO43_27080 [Flavobacterium sp.]